MSVAASPLVDLRPVLVEADRLLGRNHAITRALMAMPRRVRATDPLLAVLLALLEGL